MTAAMGPYGGVTAPHDSLAEDGHVGMVLLCIVRGLSVRSQGQTAYCAARLASSLLRRAPCFAAARRSGSAAPVPKSNSSGVWLRNAERGMLASCAST